MKNKLLITALIATGFTLGFNSHAGTPQIAKPAGTNAGAKGLLMKPAATQTGAKAQAKIIGPLDSVGSKDLLMESAQGGKDKPGPKNSAMGKPAASMGGAVNR